MKKVTLLVCAAVMTGTASMRPPPDPVQDENFRRECPMDWDQWWEQSKQDSVLTRLQKKPPVPPSSIWPNVNIPEFHDCQKFVEVDDVNGRGYTKAFFAILADTGLASLEERFDTLETCRSDCEPAADSSRQRVTSILTDALPAAWIYADGGGYPRLGIGVGANCLLLSKEAGRWQAWMISMEQRLDVDCLSPQILSAATGGITRLPVQVSTESGFGADDYPPVARWDWDFDSKQPYIGMRCGPNWCEIGNPRGFTPSQAHSSLVEVPTDPKSRRTVEIKGWYDEQYLATRRRGMLEPTAIVGTIFPDTMLGPEHDATRSFSRFTRVARVALREDLSVRREADLMAGDAQAYADKFNFDLTPGRTLNEIFVCRGSWEACGIPRDSVPEDSPHDYGPKCRDSTDAWWARIDNTSRESRFYCIKRHTAGLDPPGTVRWRWLLHDEGEWVRCIRGCCEVHGPS